jgi:hypothetical protein
LGLRFQYWLGCGFGASISVLVGMWIWGFDFSIGWDVDLGLRL